jgi:hypothetical protein
MRLPAPPPPSPFGESGRGGEALRAGDAQAESRRSSNRRADSRLSPPLRPVPCRALARKGNPSPFPGGKGMGLYPFPTPCRGVWENGSLPIPHTLSGCGRMGGERARGMGIRAGRPFGRTACKARYKGLFFYNKPRFNSR